MADGTYTPSETYSPSDGTVDVVGGQFAIDVAGGAIWPEFTVPSTGDTFRFRDDLGTSLTTDELARLRTFDLPDGVAIYGGFQGQSGPGGGESLLTDRPADLTTFRTILSGDIAGDDLAGDPEAFKDDNVWHVVTLGNDVEGTGVTALLNGLTIEGGRADGPRARGTAGRLSPATTGPVGWEHDAGGGVFVGTFSALELERVVVRENQAGNNGGGVRVVFTNILAADVGPT